MKIWRLEIKWHRKLKPYKGITAACDETFTPSRTHWLCGGCECACHMR